MDKFAIVIAGPSGAGKTTVAEALISSLGNLEMSRSATTRERRGDGKDDEYIYLSKEEFKSAIADGDMLEYTEYSENFYGTRKLELSRIWNEGKNPILVLDYYGARSLKERLDVPVYAIYVYTSLSETMQRLVKREEATPAPEEKKAAILKKRMLENISDYKKLSEFAGVFDFYLENDDIDVCVKDAEEALKTLSFGKILMDENAKLEMTGKFAKEAEVFERTFFELVAL